MAIPLSLLEGRLREVSERVTAGIEKTVQLVGRGIAQELIPATPVLTGFARGNWRPTLNAPSTRPVTFLDPTGAATISRIIAVSQSYRLGDSIFIVNRAPYIAQLNAGSSDQAPPNFVAIAVKRGTARGLQFLREGIL